MSKKVTLIDTKKKQEKIYYYNELSINLKRILFVNDDGLPVIAFHVDDIALEDHLQNIIGNQKAQKIIKIEDVKDSNELKEHLISRDKKSLPSNVYVGGKRKRKTRKSKRPRKSKKSKRKTNRKKI
tara:strand:- start:754 stop:1131 length:378 start_codon:yes stop_codon:yes gene_type:complete